MSGGSAGCRNSSVLLRRGTQATLLGQVGNVVCKVGHPSGVAGGSATPTCQHAPPRATIPKLIHPISWVCGTSHNLIITTYACRSSGLHPMSNRERTRAETRMSGSRFRSHLTSSRPRRIMLRWRRFWAALFSPLLFLSLLWCRMPKGEDCLGRELERILHILCHDENA